VSIVLYEGGVSQSSWYAVLLLLKEGIAGGDSAVWSSIPAMEGGMFSKHVRLCLLIVALVALGLTPAVYAGTRSAGRATVRAARSHAPQPGFLQILWRGVSQIFEKEGAGLDPHGTPNTSNTQTPVDPSLAPHNG
jgi:hypothetical protein